MADYLSPGVFIEEVPATVQITQAVSASAFGCVGFTPKGPTDTATLVSSWKTFTDTFGDLTSDSYTGYVMSAYFANGGRTAYVVRVVPSDATLATGSIYSRTTGQTLELGDGVTAAIAKTSTTSLLKDNSGASPIIPGTLSIKWRGADTPITGQTLKTRDGTTNVASAAVTVLEFRVSTASLPAVDTNLMVVVPGTATLKWTDAGGAQSLAIPVPTSGSITTVTGTSGGVGAPTATIVFDHATGIGSVTFGTVTTASVKTMDYTPATATYTINDSLGTYPAGTWTYAAGVLTGGAGTRTIDYSTGAYTFTTGATVYIPHNKSPIVATYDVKGWTLAAKAKGKWGNNVRVRVVGNADSYVTATGAFGTVDAFVDLMDSTGSYAVKETYEALTATPATDPYYFAEVITKLSDLVSVTTPGANEIPGKLQPITRTLVLGGGDDSSGGKQFGVTPTITLPLSANCSVVPRTLTITYTATGASTTSTITHNGTSFAGAYDSAGTNSLVASTGVLSFKTLNTVKAGTLVTITYAETPAETTHSEVLGDATKTTAMGGDVVGSDGTFTANTYGVNQLTSSTLSSTSAGIYALDAIEDIMTVAVPDLAGDVTAAADQITYCASRTALSSGGDRFALFTPAAGSTPTEATEWLQFELAQYSSYNAIYWPWVKVSDALANGRPKTIPNFGHIAGVYARTDSTKNVAKAPGGIVDGALVGLIGLEYKPTQADRDLVYPKHINPLINTTATGLAVWGVRTTSKDTTWRYVSTRRLFMLLEKSIYNSIQWAVFESNGPRLWAQVKSQLNSFLLGLFNTGYFSGTSPSQAFYIICDETNNTASTIAAGQLIVDVGVAANTPAEFIRVRFTQITP